MNEFWILQLLGDDDFEVKISGPASVGRQDKRKGETWQNKPYFFQGAMGTRVVIAPLEETAVPRDHLEVTPQANGRFTLRNINDRQAVGLPNNQELKPGESREVFAPIVLRLGSKTVRLEVEDPNEALLSLPAYTIAPGRFGSLAHITGPLAGEGSGLEADQLTVWINTILTLLESAATTENFFANAAKALFDLVQVDSGRVLLWEENKWHEKTAYPEGSLRSGRWSSRVLGSCHREKKTFWKAPEGTGSSIRDVEAVVAAPILNRKGEVIGALYGERKISPTSRTLRPISQLDARFAEVLAMVVAFGLSRIEQDKVQHTFEQFFTPDLAARLIEHPEMLDGRKVTVSVLFCDIRGFSGISERLGPARTFVWINDVMSVLSKCVLDHEGVVVDYIGDELMAMWGAPADQPKHASLACRAALAMIECMPRLNEKWQAELNRQEPMSVGIGINSGEAQVGNVGSKIKFKFGPLGNTVNVASRVQGATKYLKTPLLITEATHSGLEPGFATRRLCQVGVVNISEPVTLYELVTPGDGWLALKEGYENALEHFTQEHFREACQILGRLIPEHRDDGPALILLSRAVNFLVEPKSFDPVFKLPGK